MGIIGMMYMMLPQLPNRARVADVQTGQKAVSIEAEIGPKLFHTMPSRDNERVEFIANL